MSIATEIKRLQNAKVDIKTAIEEKGVEVGNGTIDTYAEKIGEISFGGEEKLPINIAEIKGGTWTQATHLEANGVLEVEHGLTTKADIVVISSNIFDIAPTGAYFLGFANYDFDANTSTYSVYYNGNISTRSSQSLENRADGIVACDDIKFTIKTAGNRRLGAGVTYSWIAIRWAK